MGPHIELSGWTLLRLLPGGCQALATLVSGGVALPGTAQKLAMLLGGAAFGGGMVLALQGRGPEGKRKVDRGQVEAEREKFQAAAEASQDAFYILDSVRDEKGAIVDFTLRYLNATAEKRLKAEKGSLVGARASHHLSKMMDERQFRRYLDVVETGAPLTVEFAVRNCAPKATWLRHHAVRLGDGIALSSKDLSEFKAVQDRYENVSEFSEHIFEQAPFSIIATDAAGTITAMNLEAERLTGYKSRELAGNASLLQLHDPQELLQRSAQREETEGVSLKGLELIVTPPRYGNGQSAMGHSPVHAAAPSAMAQSGQGSPADLCTVQRGLQEQVQEQEQEQVQEQEWTFIRRDGTRVPVSLAVKVLTGPKGERTGLIAMAYDMSKRRHLEPDATAASLHDDLTGLVGKSLLDDRIAQAIKRCHRAGTKVAVLTIDIDHFKRINDALGHPVGDEILNAAAERLLKKVRASDTVARIGGDEFIVLLPDHTELANIEFCADQLLQALSSPYAVDGHSINVTASVGMCVCPDLATDVEHLLRRSETAMNWAKEAGRNRAAIFTPKMLVDAHSRLSMEGALRQALDRDELFLEYQPQVALPSGKVIGMEALLRWRHPRLGLVSPAHFIPMAEKVGLLPEFGMWVMRQACLDAKWIQEQMGRRVSLSVNLSPNQFAQAKLLRTIEEALEESKLHPNDLEIEIIENTLMINSTANLKTLQRIRDLGVGLSIDDFGTGFCNFNYLLQYQVDRLKIDQSFVRQAAADVNAASVVRTVIAMSHGLGVKVIAEGVETRDQLKFLLRRRCDQAQGYFFAKPLSREEYVEAIPGIERMNLSDPSGERAAVVGAEQKGEYVRSKEAPLRPIAMA